MTDIELVIKIPERDYDLACNYPDALIATYAHYIKDGTPLPEGHGRIGDVDKLYDIFNKACEEYNIDNIAFMSDMDMNFYLAQTIV